MKKNLLSFLLVFTSAISAIANGHIIIVSSKTPVSCYGLSDGQVTISVSGGVGPFTYSWLPVGGTDTTATRLVAGTYTLTVTDQSDQSTAIKKIIITQPQPLYVFLFKTDLTCGEVNGSVTMSGGQAQGGTYPYSYQWSSNVPISPFDGPQTNNLTTGIYYVIVTDGNGCIVSDTTTINNLGSGALTGITVSDSVYNESCPGMGDGAIDISLSGSNPGPFVYKWNNTFSTQDLTNLYATNYSLVIWDTGMSNCISKIYQVRADFTNCGSLSGNVFDDNNLNCIKNSGEMNLQSMVVVANPGNRMAFTNYQGNYTFNSIPFGTYTLTHYSGNPYIFPTCATVLNTTLYTGNNIISNLNFSDNIQSVSDITICAFITSPTPGFVSTINATLNNLTKIIANGTVCVVLPPGFGSLITSGDPIGYSVNGDTVCWNYSNLSYYGAMNFSVKLTIPTSTPVGTILNLSATATMTGTDINLSNNKYCYQAIVTGSYDPNNKSVNPIGQGVQGNLTTNNNLLTYHINFQNTGNGPAVNIVVKDTLSDKLDISTLEVIATSHDYILDVMSGNVLRWKFNNIMLADSVSNQAASHGWISYRVKQKTSNQIGDQIKNTAYIYFDFNSAIVTNTTLNTIAAPVGVEKIVGTNTIVKVYPNPNNGNMECEYNVKSTDTGTIKIYDLTGKLMEEYKLNSNNNTLTLTTNLSNGIYLYQIIVNDKIVKSDKLVIIK